MKSLLHSQSIFYALGFLALAGVGVWFMWQQIDNRGEELAEQFQLIEDQRQFEQRFNSLVRTVEETEEERAALHEFILQNETDTINLLSDLDAIARGLQLSFTTQDLRVESTGERFDTLVASFNFSGREGQVMDMVELFESLPYQSDVTRLSFRRRPGVVGEVLSDAALSISISIQKYDN